MDGQVLVPTAHALKPAEEAPRQGQGRAPTPPRSGEVTTVLDPPLSLNLVTRTLVQVSKNSVNFILINQLIFIFNIILGKRFSNKILLIFFFRKHFKM